MSRPGYPIVILGHATASQKVYNSSGVLIANENISTATFPVSYVDKVGDNTPGWPEVKHDNPYSARGYTSQGTSAICKAFSTTVGGGNTYDQSLPLNWLCGAGDPLNNNASYGISDQQIRDAVRNKVISKLAAKIKSQKVNVGQIIGERRQTVSLVTSSARRLAEAIMAVKRGNFKAASRSLFGSGRRGDSASERRRRRNSTDTHGGIRGNVSGIPEQWLALQYGWKPLLSDIYGSCEELANLVTGSPPVCSAFASASMRLDDVLVQKGSTDGSRYPPKIELRRSGAHIHGSGYLQYGVSSEFGQTLSRTGIINPYAVAWELLPYSFVVDWFLPVGNYLSSLDFETGLSFQRGWIAIKQTTPWHLGMHAQKLKDSSFETDYSAASCSWDGTEYTREVLSATPLPSPPSFKDPFSLTHMANALSLLATAFGSDSSFRVPH